ncbi:MAG: hypothetical protein IKR39_02275 [Lachnospiraceae bacterium]|nr:hypothetical protein [Lachnospiraceae bacterium]
MRRCPYCKVEITGDLYKCPLCQSKLMGTAEEPYFPKLEAQKKRSILYKLQLFFVWVVLIVGVGLDFMVGLRLPSYPNLHWSVLLAMWLVTFEFGIMRQFKPGFGSAGKVTMLTFITIALWCVTAHYFGFMQVTLDIAVPSALAAVIITNFVLVMIDKNGNTMSYLLSALLLGVVPSVVQFFVRDSMPLAWSICTMISVVLFAGALVFRGKAVIAELQKRFHV